VTFVIEPANPQGADALRLLREAAIDARALYPELFAPDSPWPTNPPFSPRGVYVVVYLANRPVGCGTLRELDAQTAEVRRVYVHCEYRRRRHRPQQTG